METSHEAWRIRYSTDPYINLYPDWGYKVNLVNRRSFSQMQEGQLNTFTKVSSIWEFAIPISYMDSQTNAAIVNSWWSSQADLELQINSTDTYNVRIMNDRVPFNQNVENKFADYKGTLILRTY